MKNKNENIQIKKTLDKPTGKTWQTKEEHRTHKEQRKWKIIITKKWDEEPTWETWKTTEENRKIKNTLNIITKRRWRTTTMKEHLKHNNKTGWRTHRDNMNNKRRTQKHIEKLKHNNKKEMKNPQVKREKQKKNTYK